MNTQPTTAQIYNQAATRTMREVCRLLQWDEMQYAEHRYRNGIAYLHWYLPVNERQRDTLERSKLFWNWFKTLCTTNDECFVMTEGLYNLRLDLIRSLYASFHCPHILAVECKPDAAVLDELKNKTLC